jgi:hypothetical protein
MKGRFRLSFGVMLATVVMALLSIEAATAQPLNWNPPCPNMRVHNTSFCPALLTLRTVPAGAIPPINVPACAIVNVPVPPGVQVTDVISQAGALVPLVGPAPVVPGWAPCWGAIVPPFVGPAIRWVRGVVLGPPVPPPPPGCCFDVFFYPGEPNYPCSVWLFPGTGVCVP